MNQRGKRYAVNKRINKKRDFLSSQSRQNSVATRLTGCEDDQKAVKTRQKNESQYYPASVNGSKMQLISLPFHPGFIKLQSDYTKLHSGFTCISEKGLIQL